MVKVKISFLVEKHIDHVFAFISNIANYSKWVPENSGFFIGNKITSEGAIGIGTTYIDQLRWFGKSIGEVVQYRPPSDIEFRQMTLYGLPLFNAKINYKLNAVHNFTEVFHDVEAVPCGVFKLLEPKLSNDIRYEREQTCKAIKRELEGV